MTVEVYIEQVMSRITSSPPAEHSCAIVLTILYYVIHS